MQANAQSSRAASRYAPHTRLGNWFEELALDEAKQGDFQRRAYKGSSHTNNYQEKMALCKQRVPHSYSNDDHVRFGDYVVIVHENSSAALACDPFDDVQPPWQKFNVSATLDSTPIARTTFRIMHPPADFKDPLRLDRGDGILRYGQPFVLSCNESLLYKEGSIVMNPRLYVASTIKNERTATRSSNRQSVFVQAAFTADTVWTCMRPSAGRLPSNERYISIGSPVSRELSFVLVHQLTNCYLKTDRSRPEYTDFGPELEVAAERTLGVGKLGLVVSEMSGASTPQTLTKPDMPTNLWHFQYASDPRDAEEYRNIPPPATFEYILREVRDQVLSRGLFCFVELRRHFEDTFSGGILQPKDTLTPLIVHRQDAGAALMSFGIYLEEIHIDILLSGFDASRTGFIDLRDLIVALYSDHPATKHSKQDNDARDALVKEAFSRLANNAPSISFSALRSSFHPDQLPFVQDSRYSETEAWKSFNDAFSRKKVTKTEEPMIKFAQFKDFHRDIGACIQEDSAFAAVAKAWN